MLRASRRPGSRDDRRRPPGAPILDVRFVLELCALGALSFWGFQLDASTGVRVLAGLGAPLAAAVVWGLFASPRARLVIPWVGRLAVQVAVFAVAVAALAHADRPPLAWGLGIAAAVNAALLAWWQQ